MTKPCRVVLRGVVDVFLVSWRSLLLTCVTDCAPHATEVRVVFLCVALGKAVVQHADFTELAAGPDGRAAILNKALTFAPAVDRVKAVLVLGDNLRHRHPRQVDDIEWCCSQLRSKWVVCRSDPAPTGPTVRTLPDVNSVANFAEAARRLKTKHGLRGRFVDYPLAMLAC
jgi:hypothetical protein